MILVEDVGGSVDAGGEEILGIADGGEIQDAPVLGVDDVLLLGLPQGGGEEGAVIAEIGGGTTGSRN